MLRTANNIERHPAGPRLSMRRHGSAGFSLVELMVTVAVVGILAAVALFSIRKGRSLAAMNEFGSAIKTAFKEARGRAIANGRTYAVQIIPTDGVVGGSSVRWCETDCSAASLVNPDLEKGRVVAATEGVRALLYAPAADINKVIAAPSRVSIPGGGITVYFRPDGSVDSDITTSIPEGFTVYLEHSKVSGLKHRIAIIPLSGDIRTYHKW